MKTEKMICKNGDGTGTCKLDGKECEGATPHAWTKDDCEGVCRKDIERPCIPYVPAIPPCSCGKPSASTVNGEPLCAECHAAQGESEPVDVRPTTLSDAGSFDRWDSIQQLVRAEFDGHVDALEATGTTHRDAVMDTHEHMRQGLGRLAKLSFDLCKEAL